MSKWTAIAECIRQSHEKAGGRSAESARSQENGLYTLYALGRSPVSEVANAANGERQHALNVPPAAATIAPEQRAAFGAGNVPDAELRALVDAVAAFHGFTLEQRAEAHEIAQADQAAALECFRIQAAKIPKAERSSDDRITCNQCANLVGRRCAKWKEMGAARGWEPAPDENGNHRLIRCEQFKPETGEQDQRTGAQRWPNLSGKPTVH